VTGFVGLHIGAGHVPFFVSFGQIKKGHEAFVVTIKHPGGDGGHVGGDLTHAICGSFLTIGLSYSLRFPANRYISSLPFCSRISALHKGGKDFRTKSTNLAYLILIRHGVNLNIVNQHEIKIQHTSVLQFFGVR